MIELLVVIAVVAILASLLLPALGRARDKAGGAFCLNNLKQWGVATLLYADDHNDFLPGDGKAAPTEADLANPGYHAWYVQLAEQINAPRYVDMPWRTNASLDPGRTIWLCPQNRRRADASSTSNNLFHYCLNEHVTGTGANNRPVKLSSIRRTSMVVWLFDNGKLAAVAQQNNVHTNLHGRGAQFLFLDGHVARFGNREYWDFAANQGLTNNPGLVWIP